MSDLHLVHDIIENRIWQMKGEHIPKDSCGDDHGIVYVCKDINNNLCDKELYYFRGVQVTQHEYHKMELMELLAGLND